MYVACRACRGVGRHRLKPSSRAVLPSPFVSPSALNDLGSRIVGVAAFVPESPAALTDGSEVCSARPSSKISQRWLPVVRSRIDGGAGGVRREGERVDVLGCKLPSRPQKRQPNLARAMELELPLFYAGAGDHAAPWKFHNRVERSGSRSSFGYQQPLEKETHYDR